MQEFDNLGREAFLDKYKFKKSRRFFIEHDGRLYDSKPILGAAHGVQYPDRGALKWDEFSGGETTTRQHLIDLGFKVADQGPASGSSTSTDPELPIGELIEEISALQPSWAKENTPAMQERGRLVKELGR